MRDRTLTYSLAGLLSLAALPAVSDTLQDVYLLALKNDHQLKADTARYQAGKENSVIARARLLPQINGNMNYSDSSSDSSRTVIDIDDETGALDIKTFDSESDSTTTNYSVTLNQPLFNLPAWFGYKQGVSLSEQAEAQFSADQQALIIRVSEAYFNVLRAVDNLETSIAEEKALNHRLQQTKQRFEVGLTAITDVHEAQAAYDTATAATLQARGNLGIVFEEMEAITGTTLKNIAPLSEKFPVIKPTPAERSEWVEFALQNNFDLKVAKLSSDASRQNAKAKKAAHYPTLTGSLSYQDSDNESDIAGVPNDSASKTHTVAVRLDVPIYSGGSVSGQRRQAYQQFMQNQELYNKAQRDTIQGARSLHLQVVTNVAQVKARAQAITSSLSALEATQAGYDVGTRNLVDVLVAQQNVYEARRNYSTALYDYVVNTLKLKEVAGILTPQDVKDLNQWLTASKSVDRSKYEK